jgi:ubiquinone/menaquinone biosynthesis C-methylase UbiE
MRNNLKGPVIPVILAVAVVLGLCPLSIASDDTALPVTGLELAAPTVYEQRPPSRGGTGKVYLGREIAKVMGHQSAEWLDRTTRDSEERTGALIDMVDLASDAEIADIGAGSGYFTFLLAPKVPGGKVYAVDIQQEMLDLVETRKREKAVANVATVLGNVDDVKLAAASLDAALLVDAYHEFSHPREMLASLSRALRPGGRIFLVEYRAEDASLPIHPLHRMSEAQAKIEFTAAGFVWKETRVTLPRQHVMIFARP